MSAMHYSGTIIGPRVCVYPGWAACCSGERTMKLRREGKVTPDRALVTCKRCLTLIAGHDKWEADAPARRAAAGLPVLDRSAVAARRGT